MLILQHHRNAFNGIIDYPTESIRIYNEYSLGSMVEQVPIGSNPATSERSSIRMDLIRLKSLME